MTTTAASTRGVRRRRTITVGTDKYRIGKKATRTVAKNAEGTSKTVTLAKKAGGSVVKTLTKSAEAKNLRVGAYARAHATTNADGTVTYAKKGGGTVTKSLAVSGEPKKKKRRTSSSGTGTGTGSSNTNPGNGNPGY